MHTIRNSDFIHKILYLLAFLTVFALCTPAKAQGTHTRLTQKNIKTFIEKTSKITNGMHNDMTDTAVQDYLDAHLHEKSRFKSTLQFNIPGFPARENSLALNKEEFIASIQSGASAIDKYTHKIKVKDIRISSDERKATVITSTSEEGLMNVNDGDNIQQVPVTGTSTCHQILMLSDRNVIQMFNANCETVITFEEF